MRTVSYTHLDVYKRQLRNCFFTASDTCYGTAFNKLFNFFKLIWYWWADAPIKQQKQVSVKVDKFISKTPSVKFRGVFINDEDWEMCIRDSE